MSIAEEILNTIDYALKKKLPELPRDITLLSVVTNIGKNNTYTVTNKGVNYTVKVENLTLKEMDVVHLVIPNGQTTNKYILEDLIMKYVVADLDVKNLSNKYDELLSRVTALENAADRDTNNV